MEESLEFEIVGGIIGGDRGILDVEFSRKIEFPQGNNETEMEPGFVQRAYGRCRFQSCSVVINKTGKSS